MKAVNKTLKFIDLSQAVSPCAVHDILTEYLELNMVFVYPTIHHMN